ncbi:MAG: hypothetical protein ACXWUG_05275 [Polyangiales bacterium]
MLVETLPPQQLLTLRILWASITSSTLVFLLVLDMAHLPAHRPNPTMIPVLAVAALGCLAVGIILPRTTLRAKREARRPAVMFQTAAILGLAMTEAIALFGLVLGFQGFDLPVFLPFFVVAWLVFALRFPRPTHPLGFLGPALGQQ